MAPQTVHAALRTFYLQLGVDIDRPEQMERLANDLAYLRMRREIIERRQKRRALAITGVASAIGTALIGALIAYVFPGAMEWLTLHWVTNFRRVGN